jgi:hypothetical protein
MSRGTDGSRPFLAVLLAYWPLLLFVPAVLVLITVLVLVTRWWDKRDAAARAATATPLSLVRTPAPSQANRPSPLRSGGGVRRSWFRRTRCTCSWHDMGPAPLVAVPAHEDHAQRAEAPIVS